MSDVVFRHAAAGEERAVIDFINQNFDMRLPLINRPEFYRHYYAGMGGVPQFVVAEQDGRYLSAAGYIRREIGSRLAMRHTPEFQFIADDSIEYGVHISRLLREIAPEEDGAKGESEQ